MSEKEIRVCYNLEYDEMYDHSLLLTQAISFTHAGILK